MGAEFFSLISLLNSLMWSEGPSAWRLIDAIANENNT